MSSTAKQIDDAKKMEQLAEEGKAPQAPEHASSSNESGSGAYKTPEKPDVVSDDMKMEGMNRENFPVVDAHEAVPVVGNREIAPVVGRGQEHSLADQFKNPLVRAEEQTALEEDSISTAQKQTRVPDSQQSAEKRLEEARLSEEEADQTSAAKQTRVEESSSDKDEKKDDKQE